MVVWCVIIDHDRTILVPPFKAVFPPHIDINDLRIRVVSDLSNIPALTGVNPALLIPYHSATICLGLKQGQLKTAISELDLDSAEVIPDEIASEVASGRELLILQKPAPPKQSFKRPLSPSALNEFESLIQTKIARRAPSDMAKASEYTSIQKNPEERIFDERPHPDAHIAPIGLLYSSFGEFKDIFASGVPPNDTRAIDLRNVEENVDTLAAAMSDFYEKEFERRDAALPFLNAIFEYKMQPGEIGSVRSDVHCEVDGIISTIAEFKNVPAAAFPHAQCVGYIARSHVRGERVKDLCNRRTLPSLAITFTGDLVQFYAVILLGHQYRAVALTPALSFSLWATDETQRTQLLNAFIAANALQQQIHRDLKSYIDPKLQQLQQDQLLRSPGRFFLPSVTKILKYGANDKNRDYIDFTILDQVADTGKKTFRNRHLYEAQLTRPANSSHILVKFSRHYSIDLHSFCYERGHAPMILGFERLPGGWFAIAMEYLANAKFIDSGLSPYQRSELKDFVTEFHSQGFVHGDLRDANILYNGDNFWLIDFDWGGKVGEARYHTWLLHEELLSGRQSNDLIIRAVDDLRILCATLKNLEDPK